MNSEEHKQSTDNSTSVSTDPLATETDYYKLLGINRNATEDQIKKGYRKMAIKYHPDKGGDAEIFKKVSQAYSILSDPEKKKVYDEYGEEGIKGEAGSEEYNNFNPFDIFGSFFGFDDFSSFSPSFHSFGKRQRGQKAEDCVIDLPCTLEELYKGCNRTVPYKRRVICVDCKGKGSIATANTKCKRCKGYGMETKVIRERGITQQFQTTCSLCKGSGIFISKKDQCKKCSGRGVVIQNKKEELDIPKGAFDGYKLRFVGLGDEEVGVRAADLVFVIKEKPHKVFKRTHSSLSTQITISLVESLCGFSRELELLDGRKIRVKSPTGTVIKPGSQRVVPGEGMPKVRGGKGDLWIYININYPDTLSEQETSELARIFNYNLNPISTEDIDEVKMVVPTSKHHEVIEKDEKEYEEEESMNDYFSSESTEPNECCIL